MVDFVEVGKQFFELFLTIWVGVALWAKTEPHRLFNPTVLVSRFTLPLALPIAIPILSQIPTLLVTAGSILPILIRPIHLLGFRRQVLQRRLDFLIVNILRISSVLGLRAEGHMVLG